MTYPDEQTLIRMADSIGRDLSEFYFEHPGVKPEDCLQDGRLTESFSSLFSILLSLAGGKKEYLPQMAGQLFAQRPPEVESKALFLFCVDVVQSFCQSCLSDELAPQAELWRRQKAADEDFAQPATEREPEPDAAAETEPAAATETASAVTNPAAETEPAAETNPNSAITAANAERAAGQEYRLLRLLSWSFPGETILLNWPFRSYLFEAYLPRLRLAVKLGAPPRTPSQTGLWLKKENITIFWIAGNMLNDPLGLRRQLTLAAGKADRQGIRCFKKLTPPDKQENPPAPSALPPTPPSKA
jgi:hypothetical protein